MILSSKENKYLELINLNQALIHKVASVYASDVEEKKDLVQEIYFQIWKSYDSFKGESKISTWLYRISMNTSIRFLKNKNRITHLRSSTNVVTLVNEDSAKENERSIQNLLESIHNLNELDKGIVLLYLEEKSHKEIADIIGISVSNVGTRFLRIKDKLKKMTKPEKWT